MAVTNLISDRLVSTRYISGYTKYQYEGVIDAVGHRLNGTYIDDHSQLFQPTCSYTYQSDCGCCGNSGPPYYNCNDCGFYKLYFEYGIASGSFGSSATKGYYDSATNKGFRSFGSVGAYSYPDSIDITFCSGCTGYNEANTWASYKDIYGQMAYAGVKAHDGSLWTWGYNGYGVLGNGTSGGITTTKSPVQLGSNSWKMVSGGVGGDGYNGFFCAIRSDGTLWCWGGNIYGQVGDGTTTYRISPVQISGGGSNWKFVSCGYYTSYALKTDGTLWSWGMNNYGQIGDGTTTNRSSPVQVAGGGDWKFVRAGVNNGYGIKKNGKMFAWGYNGNYSIGDGTNTHRSSPVQIGSAISDWKDVSENSYFGGTYAIRSNGTLFGWGWYPGGLASGQYVSPIQIGSATNHASGSSGVVYSRWYYNNVASAGFITTDGNLIAYQANNSTQTTLYNGGSAKELIRTHNSNDGTGYPPAWLRKDVK